MKFCTDCGKQIDDNAIFCPHCGTRVNGDGVQQKRGGGFGSFGGFNPYGPFSPYQPYPVYDQRENILISIISFLCWQIGLIIWLVSKRSRPGISRSAAKGLCAGTSLVLPLFGAILKLLWRDDQKMRDYSKIAGISALIGVVLYALFIMAVAFIGSAGVIPEGTQEIGDTVAFILGSLRSI